MRLEGRRESENVEDRRGMGTGTKIGLGGIGGLIIAGLITLFMGGNLGDVLEQASGMGIQNEATTQTNFTEEEQQLAQFARIIELCLLHNLSGIYNVSNGSKIAKADLLRLFVKYFPTTLTINDDPAKHCDKSLTKNPDFDFNIPNYDTMIRDMRDWIVSHINLYPHLKERIE